MTSSTLELTRVGCSRKMLDNCSLLQNLLLILFIAENPISHNPNYVNVLRSKLTLNEESSDKSINYQFAFVDMSVRTTSACCEKPDRNSDSQVISNWITALLLPYFNILRDPPNNCSRPTGGSRPTL
ncbi:conserved hypothetical protein [Trichinella spiralis]|uniref:hypothetical protein n=1 Tax=Trichinella spiralis TaxID=6334 RepID=UPI0001EFD843|nr:conserved hypothetical protein [Trichinella spiralis]XP_003370179.1 conserved hypothetical protein [Trichinella spiralis]